jgi:hypothetical protein
MSEMIAKGLKATALLTIFGNRKLPQPQLSATATR